DGQLRQLQVHRNIFELHPHQLQGLWNLRILHMISVRRFGLSIACLLILGAATTAAGHQVTVRFLSTIDSPQSQGTVTIRSMVTTSATSPRRLPVPLPGAITIDLTPGSYSLELEADSWWMQPRILHAGHESDVSVALRRTGTVGGTVSSPVASTGNLSIRFDAAEGEPLSGEAHCASDAAAFACTIPQGVFDIRVSLPGHVPVYKRHVRIEPDHRLPLGDIRLVPGASLSGFVKAEEGNLRDAKLALVSTSRPVATLTANVDTGGFFSVGPVAPGDYTLRAFQKGLISPELKVMIRPGLEARLRQPLLLAKPRRVAVSILPPTDPLGGAWFVRLLSV